VKLGIGENEMLKAVSFEGFEMLIMCVFSTSMKEFIFISEGISNEGTAKAIGKQRIKASNKLRILIIIDLFYILFSKTN